MFACTLTYVSPFRNVSKQNYSFSDFPFPNDATDFPHNTEMHGYIKRYVDHVELAQLIQFHTQVNSIQKEGTCTWKFSLCDDNNLLKIPLRWCCFVQ